MIAEVQDAEVVEAADGQAAELKPSRTERRINDLETRIAALEARNAAMSEKVDALESQYGNMIGEMKKAAAKQMLQRPEVQAALEDQLAERIEVPGMPSSASGPGPKINPGGVVVG